MTPARIALAATALLYALFHLWYGGTGSPMAPSEAQELVDRIEARARAANADAYDAELIRSFRVLAERDDGGEFYMLNLMRFREKAQYPPSLATKYGADVREAARRYNEAVVPALLRRASLPVLLGEYAGPFIPASGAERWDQVGIVRYRSRRDMLEMALALARSGDGVHKRASIEHTVVFPVEPVFDLVFVRGAVFALCAAAGGSLAWLLRRRSEA